MNGASEILFHRPVTPGDPAPQPPGETPPPSTPETPSPPPGPPPVQAWKRAPGRFDLHVSGGGAG
jgi:hypothetical protein